MGVAPLRGAGLPPGSAIRLVTACHEGPTGRGQAVMRSGAPSGPPNANTKTKKTRKAIN